MDKGMLSMVGLQDVLKNIYSLKDAYVYLHDCIYSDTVRPILLFVGVSECIIMGIPMGIGTGLFKLLHKYPFTKLFFMYQINLYMYIGTSTYAFI